MGAGPSPHPRLGATPRGEERGPCAGRGQLAQGVLAQAAVDVRVGVAERAPIRAPQRHLPLAGALLSAAGAPVVQGLGLGRVPGGSCGQGSAARGVGAASPTLPPPGPGAQASHGEGPAGPRAVIHGAPRCSRCAKSPSRTGRQHRGRWSHCEGCLGREAEAGRGLRLSAAPPASLVPPPAFPVLPTPGPQASWVVMGSWKGFRLPGHPK